MIPTLEQAISVFGRNTAAKLSNIAIIGAPEDQLRGPLEMLIADLALLSGYQPGALAIVGKTTLAEDRTRPDYAVTLTNTRSASLRSRRRERGPIRASSRTATTRPSGSG